MKTISYQTKTINKDIEKIKTNQIEILELKSLTEMKTPLEGINSRFKETGEKKISKCEYRSTEIMQSEEQEEKRMKKNKQNLRNCGTTSSAPTYT